MHPRATKHPSVGAVVLDAARVSSILDKFGLSILLTALSLRLCRYCKGGAD